MATHSSIFAWRIPWTEKPGRLQSLGSQSWTWLSMCTDMRAHTHTPSSKQQGAPGVCTKWKVSIGRRLGQGRYQQKREKGLVLAQAISPWGEGGGNGMDVCRQSALPPLGGGQGMERAHMALPRKFQTG